MQLSAPSGPQERVPRLLAKHWSDLRGFGGWAKLLFGAACQMYSGLLDERAAWQSLRSLSKPKQLLLAALLHREDSVHSDSCLLLGGLQPVSHKVWQSALLQRCRFGRLSRLLIAIRFGYRVPYFLSDPMYMIIATTLAVGTCHY